ncbi:polycystic kidney disease protein 1-like 1 isoform X4 [Biomphalaria glabrata]|uniref:Polycystic kidney disease protein 1-like 1 isoform X4 n=1 Tax=Biomphalaria glabrata TaxID=6526 RepID=A0A9W2YIG9_BIOGL|nr:polycystic kidney disease protein 1-like 1 isoform X4 [Biomphalaria glabrata]
MEFVPLCTPFNYGLTFYLIFLGLCNGFTVEFTVQDNLCLSQHSSHWYQGCHVKTNPDAERHWRTPISLDLCSSQCRKEGFKFVAMSVYTCYCLNKSEDYKSTGEHLCVNNCKDSKLPCGGTTNNTFSIYSSSGPFIESVQLQTQVVEPNMPVSLQVMIKMNKFVNTSKEPLLHSKWENTLELLWLTRFTSGSVRITPKGSHEMAACTLAFPSSGNFHIELTARNLVSFLKSNLTVHVVTRRHKLTDIEFSVIGDTQPSCRHALTNWRDVSRNGKNVLVTSSSGTSVGTQGTTVLANSSTLLEIAASGSNLKFDISLWNGITWKKLSRKMYKEMDSCTTNVSCKITQPFRSQKSGIFTVNAKASNAHGSREKNFTIVVLGNEDVLANIITDSGIIPSYKLTSLNISLISAQLNYSFITLHYGDGTHSTVRISAFLTNSSLETPTRNSKNGCNYSFRFDHVFRSEGNFYPIVYLENEASSVQFNLTRPLIVLNYLSSIKLEFPPVWIVNKTVKLNITGINSVNVSISWTVLDTIGKTYHSEITSLDYISLVFTQIGQYEITVTVFNLLSSQSGKSYINIQEPLGSLSLQCSEEGPYLLVEQEFQCKVTINKGSDFEFYWTFQDHSRAALITSKNRSSIAEYKYTSPGHYNVSVLVNNSVSSERKCVQYTVLAHAPLRCLNFRTSSAPPGQPVNISAVTLSGADAKFVFKVNSVELLTPNLVTVRGEQTIGFVLWTSSLAGRYTATVSAFNQFSNISRSTDVLIQELAPDFGIQLLTAHFPYLTFVLRNASGHTLVRDDLLYIFKFYDGDIRSTRVPVVSREVNLPQFSQSSGVKVWKDCQEGQNVIVQVTASNQVGQTCRGLTFLDNESNADRLERRRLGRRKSRRKRRKPTLWHSTFVRSNEYASFHLENKSEDLTSLHVNYGNGFSANVTCLNDSCSWDHKLQVPGVFALDVSLYGRRADRNDQSLRSVLVVEEPIKGLQLLGPTDAGIECEISWQAKLTSGTHLLYVWSIDGVTQLPSTDDKFTQSFSRPGTHTLHVNVSNEVSSSQASITFQVKYPIVNASLSIQPVLLGNETNIALKVQGGPDFIITCDFGDGLQKTITPLSETKQEISHNGKATYENQIPVFDVHISHIFPNLGIYKVVVILSNGVSSVRRVEWARVEEPIGNVTLYTKTFQLYIQDELEVIAVVSSGKNLKFSWDFSDNSKTFVTSKGNKSIARHLFDIPDKYKVSVTVSNNLQPLGIKASLTESVDVIDKITLASISHLPESSADPSPLNTASLFLLANEQFATRKVIFEAKSNGAPVQFTFDFGDGHSSTVTGNEDIIMRVMKGRADHVYTKENVYLVQLTAFNVLSNVTVNLPVPFYVQIPPIGLKANMSNKSCLRLGETLVVYASIEAGTNVTYTWKLQEKSDMILKGNLLEHQFNTVGPGSIELEASNKVGKKYLYLEYNVRSELIGLNISVNTTITATGQSIDLVAMMIPTSAKQESWEHEWMFTSNDSVKAIQHQSFTIKTPNDRLNHAFMKSGRYIIQAKGANCLGSVLSAPISILVMSPLQSLTITMIGDAVVNASIRFKADYWQGDSLHFTWDFGDGTYVNNTLISEVTHKYSEIREYIVQLVAVNPVSSGRAFRKVFILNQPCNPPVVQILRNVNPIQRSELSFLQSEPVKWDTEIRLNCSLSNQIKYRWMVVERDSKAVIPLKFPKLNHNVMMKYMQYPMLYLPPWTLKDGKYVIHLKVEMTNTTIPVYTEEEVDFTIIPTPIVSNILGGVYRSVGSNDIIKLDGRKSYYPDNTSALLRYSWNCETLLYSNYNCSEALTSKNVSMNDPLLAFPASWLNTSIGTGFIFQLKVSKPDLEEAVSDQVINVESADNVLDIHLECPQCWRNKTNPDQKVSIRSHCQKCSKKNLTYKWEVYRFNIETGLPGNDLPANCTFLNDSQSHQLKLGTTVNPFITVAHNEMFTTSDNIFTTTPTTLRTEGKKTDRQVLKSQTSPIMIVEKKTGSRSKQGYGANWGNDTELHHSDLVDPKEQVHVGGRPVPGTEHQQPEATTTTIDKLQPPTVPSWMPKHIVQQKELPIFIRESETFTGLDKPSLVLKPGVLKQGLAYLFVLTATSLDGSKGKAEIYLEVNKAPSGGRCSVRSHRESFTIFCNGWGDEDIPLVYEISYTMRKGSSEEPSIIYQGLRHSINVRTPRSRYPVALNIAVLDRLGAKTRICSIPIPSELRQTQDVTGAQTDVLIHGMLNETYALQDFTSHSIFEGTSHDLFGPLTQLALRLNELTTTGQLDSAIRANILSSLGDVPIRNEVEVIQALRCLVEITAQTTQLNPGGLLTVTSLLKNCILQTQSIIAATNVSGNTRGLNPHILKLAVRVVSNLLSGIPMNKTAPSILNSIIEDSLLAINKLIELELQYHSLGERPLVVQDGFLFLNASHYSVDDLWPLAVDGVLFQLPVSFGDYLQGLSKTNVTLIELAGGSVDTSLSYDYQHNQRCFQSRAMSFSSLYAGALIKDTELIHSDIVSIEIYTCSGNNLVHVHHLPENDMVHITIPRKDAQAQNASTLKYYLDKSMVNIHQINATPPKINYDKTEEEETGFSPPYLQLHIQFDPVMSGRLFPVMVIISSQKPPYNLKTHVFKKQYEGNTSDIKIPIPKGFYKGSQNYFISLVEASLNSGRRHSDEIKGRYYTLNVWWGSCLYWNHTLNKWGSTGCQVLPTSSIDALHCKCSHLSTFGGYFELIPNELFFSFVDEFFSLHENPVVVILVSLILVVYGLLMVVLKQADLHDIKKGNCVYLQDNTSSHQQKYEIIMETGLCRSAGTTSRISMILHGEEGMSETRELISEDNRPMFERNSRDRFIMTLPSSLGKIFKIQLWHNNTGSSPGWFLRQVIVRDLTAGQAFYFLCQRWLAVDKEDGKVEREFTAIDGKNISFSLIFWCKGLQYLSDFHIWMSIWTCPAHSRFTRVQRLTVCLTLSLSYMCLNALWFHRSPPKIRGEFGLLDVSSHNIIVGAACCAIMLPLNLLLSFLFRRSKVQYPDYEEDKVSVNGKSVCDFSNDVEDEIPQAAVTYSILDQSVLNWQNIQDWAQKQWLKRQQPVRSSHNSVKTTQTANQFSGQSTAPIVQQTLLAEENDQASSGFEDATSQVTAERNRIKALSDASSDGRKSKNVDHCDILTASRRFFLPFWCRYVAWVLCFLICCACATLTILYGFRFGHTKSAMWIQSVYFSFMICLFIAQPFLILLIVLYTASCHRNNPSVFDHYDDGFYGEKSLSDCWSKQVNHLPEPDEDLLRGVAERSRSRYLRFAGPPQEKKLRSSRKKLIKQRRAMTLIRGLGTFIFMVVLLMIIAFGKDTSVPYHMNKSLKNILTSENSNSSSFLRLKSQLSWYKWSQNVLLESLYTHFSVGTEPQTMLEKCAHIIGHVQLRQKKLCPRNKQLDEEDCSPVSRHMDQKFAESNTSSQTWNPKIWGEFDMSGQVIQLKHSRKDALSQLLKLESDNWIDLYTQAVMVEMTLYNVVTNLFSSVTLLLEVGPAGNILTSAHIRSTYVFRYITLWDNCILGCEMLYIVVTLWLLSQQLKHLIKMKKAYFYHFWNYMELLLNTSSTLYILFYIYRFVLVSEAVEMMRSSFYEQFVNLQFLTLWDECIRGLVGLVLFCVVLKALQVLRYHQTFWRFQTIYRRSKNELLLAGSLYFGFVMSFASLSTCVFGATVYSFRSLWSSIYTISAVSVHALNWPNVQLLGINHHLDLVLFFSFTLIHGFIVTYVFVVLSHKFQKTKKCHVLAMPACQLFSFYWEQLKWFGSQPQITHTEQTDNTLPPEFTMAEILYLVEELLFRMNALLGTSGLPDKRSSFTDSDSDHNAGDDGISTGASDDQNVPVTPNILQEENRLEHRVQKIEDKLCSNEPYLAQLLKLDSIGTDILSEEKEQELRSHLEFEIFRQLQLQRQELTMFNFPASNQVACALVETPATRYSGLFNLGACSLPPDLSADTSTLVGTNRLKDPQQTSTKTSPESQSSGQDSPAEELRLVKELCLQHQKPVLFLPPKRSQSLKVPGKQASPNDKTQKQWLENDLSSDGHLRVKLQRVASSSLIQKYPHIQVADKRETQSHNNSLDKKSKVHKDIPGLIKMNKDEDLVRKQETHQNLQLLSNAQNPSSGNVSPQSSESERGHKRTDSSSGQSGHERNDASKLVSKKPELPPKPTFALRATDSMKSGRSPKTKQYSFSSDLMCAESSSGSEQEATMFSKRTLQGRRNLRKTKSRGKGKGNEGGISAPLVLEADFGGGISAPLVLEADFGGGISAPLSLEADFVSAGETSATNFDIIIHPVPSGINPDDHTMPEELL